MTAKIELCPIRVVERASEQEAKLHVFPGFCSGLLVISHPSVFKVKFKVAPNLRHMRSPFKHSEIESSENLFLARKSVIFEVGVVKTGEVVKWKKISSLWLSFSL